MAAIFRSPLFNASETFVQTHASSLRRYRPLVVGLERKGNVLPELEAHLLVATGAERAALKLLGMADGLARRLRPFAPRLIHAHFGTDGLLALPLAEALGLPLATTLHGFEISRSFDAMLLSGRLSWARYAIRKRRLQQGGDLFIAVSGAIRAKALAQGYPSERTVVHHNGIDLARFAAPAGGREAGLVLHVGRLVEKKGTRLLLDALAGVPEARLVIVGDGPLRPALERHSAARDIAERVRFLGAQPPDEVARWMGRAALLAAPSVTARDGDSEGLPTVAIEAAAASLPALVSDHSGLPEAVVDGRSGFVVPEGDVGALAARLAEMVAAPDLAARMGAAARAVAEDRFDAARRAAALELLYDGLVEAGPRCG
ncbi:MAG TPA: glycosyltransferase [Allosphingosinicella sp.]|nr:glycosyltransferase [Allosphingosinicella sp.]